MECNYACNAIIQGIMQMLHYSQGIFKNKKAMLVKHGLKYLSAGKVIRNKLSIHNLPFTIQYFYSSFANI